MKNTVNNNDVEKNMTEAQTQTAMQKTPVDHNNYTADDFYNDCSKSKKKKRTYTPYFYDPQSEPKRVTLNGKIIRLKNKYNRNLVIAKCELECAKQAKWIHKIKKGTAKLETEHISARKKAINEVIDAATRIKHIGYSRAMDKRCDNILSKAKDIKKIVSFMETVTASTAGTNDTKSAQLGDDAIGSTTTFINTRLTELLTNEINEVAGTIENERIFCDGSITDADKLLHSDNIAMNTEYLVLLKKIRSKYCK